MGQQSLLGVQNGILLRRDTLELYPLASEFGKHLPYKGIASLCVGVRGDRVAWTDGYGNIKTTIPASSVNLEPETKVVIRIGDVVSDAVYSDGSFRVPEGTLAFSPGSSGWSTHEGGEPVRWMELFLGGGNAWERFGRPRVNQLVTRIG